MAVEAQTGGPRSFPQLIQPTTVGAPPPVTSTAPVFVAPSLMMPPSMIQAPPKPQQLPASSAPIASIPLPHPYGAGLTQPINMDILRNMAALYQQQMSQNNHQALMSSCMSQPHLEQGR
ncbi:classical arabinogalactan protein 9-like [Glycine max]|uniref:classical arabinogalactan protein 9-like n=1 Tax=Glycine max TaxID=3847 RepID=UPI00023C0801|nr:classical arabinogalactan protein 9-like [Glycine max]